MKKYFLITDECSFKKEYLRYVDSKIGVNKLINDFFDNNDITSKYYYADKDRLFIDPNKDDFEKYDKYLNKPLDNGLRAFKKNSKIHKEYIKFVNNSDIEMLDCPMLWTYLNFSGKVTTSVFTYDNQVYAEVQTDVDFTQTSEGFTEIKASEYYKIKETMEGK